MECLEMGTRRNLCASYTYREYRDLGGERGRKKSLV